MFINSLLLSLNLLFSIVKQNLCSEHFTSWIFSSLQQFVFARFDEIHEIVPWRSQPFFNSMTRMRIF